MSRGIGITGQAKDAAPESDEVLAERIANGDERAFRTLMTRHVYLHLAFAERLVGSREEAEDLVQDSYAKLWTHAGTFDPKKAKFTTWFYRLLMNRCLDFKRKKRPAALPESFDAPDGGPGLETKMAERQRNRQIRAALDRIPERQRAAIVLCYFEEMSNKEAAEVLGVNLKALESLLCRGRKNLQGLLKLDV